MFITEILYGDENESVIVKLNMGKSQTTPQIL